MSVTASRLFAFDDSFVRELEGLSVPWQGAVVAAPRLLALNEPLAAELGADSAALRADDGVALLAGSGAGGRSRRRTPDISSGPIPRAWATAAHCCSAKSAAATSI